MTAPTPVTSTHIQALQNLPAVRPDLVVTIRNMKFEPANFEVKPGMVVEFVNKDIAPHTVTSEATDASGNPLFDVRLGPFGTKTFTFSEQHVGSQPYYCEFHPHMTGTVEVKPSAPPPPPAIPFEIRGMRFPQQFEVKAGQKVEFVNHDRMPHTVTSEAVDPATGEPLFRIDLPPGGRAEFEFGPEHEGIQSYFCEYHPSMAGTLSVKPADLGPPGSSRSAGRKSVDAFIPFAPVARSLPRLHG